MQPIEIAKWSEVPDRVPVPAIVDNVDLVILDANVLEDIFQSDKVNMVMLNGRLYDAATMNEKVTGNRTTKPFYWQ